MGQLGIGVRVLQILLLWLSRGNLRRVSWAMIRHWGTGKSIRVGAVSVLLVMIFAVEGPAVTVAGRAASAVRTPVICLGGRRSRVRKADAPAIGQVGIDSTAIAAVPGGFVFYITNRSRGEDKIWVGAHDGDLFAS